MDVLHVFSIFSIICRLLSLTSQNQIQLMFWMTSRRVVRITAGFVVFIIAYAIIWISGNAILEGEVFPSYTVCMVDTEVENLDNSVVLAFFIMPVVLMAYTTLIFDFVTFRLMKSWSSQALQIPHGILKFLFCVPKTKSSSYLLSFQTLVWLRKLYWKTLRTNLLTLCFNFRLSHNSPVRNIG